MMTQTSQHAEGAATARRGIKTGAGEGQAYWFFGGRTVIRSPEGARPVIIEMELGPGGHAPLHVHHNIDDSFYLLSGQIADGDTVTVDRDEDQSADGLTLTSQRPAVPATVAG